MATAEAQAHTPQPMAVTAAKTLGHVVLATNFIPPYRVDVFQELAQRCERLTILINTPMESNRNWKPDFGDLEVIQLKTLTLKRPWKHDAGFTDSVYVHLSLDVLTQLRRLKPDVVISIELGSRSLLSMKYRDWFAPKVPLVLWACVSEHSEQGRGNMRARLRKYLLPKPDALIVNGGSGRRYCTNLGADNDRIIEVPYTAIPGIFDQLPITRTAEQSHRLFCPGQLITRKGLVPLLSALGRWADRHPDQTAEIDLVGSGPLREQLEAMQHPSNLKVRITSEVPYQELSAMFGRAGIMVFPTLADEWGLVVNEAMAAGLPVLGSRYAQAVEELCIEGETGWTFRPDHDEEIDAAIETALATPPEQLNRMRQLARQKVAGLTSTTSADKIVAACKMALKRAQKK